MPQIAKVAVAAATYAIDKPYDYLIPQGTDIAVGMRVLAPFGRGNRVSEGVVLALGQGVCQDHAHALIAIARERGLPARYVSGYLHVTSDGAAHDAAHAWAEIHVGALGWVGFDAANACCPDDRYVRLGSGYDADDAAPVRGTTFGSGQESLDVRVQVEEMSQDQ